MSVFFCYYLYYIGLCLIMTMLMGNPKSLLQTSIPWLPFPFSFHSSFTQLAYVLLTSKHVSQT